MKFKENSNINININTPYKSQGVKTSSTASLGSRQRLGQQGLQVPSFRKSNAGKISSTLLKTMNIAKSISFTKNEAKQDNENTITQVPSTFATEETEDPVSLKQKVCVAPAMMGNDCGKTHQIKVVARFRPLNEVERTMDKRVNNDESSSICANFISEDSVDVSNSCSIESHFTLDRIFNCSTPQNQIYEQMAIATINDVLNGYNGTIFAYGQSGSGKTYTMYGNDLFDEAQRGIIPRAISHIFDHIESPMNRDIKYELKFSMLEIYKENLYDLLNTETKSCDLKIKEHPKKGIYVAGLSEEYISSEEEFLLLVESADENRVTAATGLNATSSRSHLLFQLEIIQRYPDDTQKRGTLNLVDLAGSEKVSKTQAMGQTLEEAKKINLSLSTLGNVIHALTSSNPNDFVPYRDSKLTRILQDSLGGNYKTTLIVTCSPHLFNSEETISTLKFAQRVKKIKNKVKINIKRSVEQLEAIIDELTRQLKNANAVINMLKGQQTGLRIQSEDSEGSSDQKIKIKFEGNSTIMLPCEQNISVEALLQKKDEEIAQLNEKIEMLTNENKRLTDIIGKSTTLNGVLVELERMTVTNIHDLNAYAEKYREIITDYSKKENEIIREGYMKLDEKFVTLKKDLERQLSADDFERTVEEFNTLTIEDQKLKLEFLVTNDWLGSDSYKNIFGHSKLYMKYFLDNFLKKKDLFSERLNITHDLLSPEAKFTQKLSSDYSYLKSSFVKLSALMVYYETLLYSFMNRAAIDIKKYEQVTQVNTEIEKRCTNLATVFSSYLQVLGEIQLVKALKNKELCLNPNQNILNDYSQKGETVTIPQIKLLESFDSQPSAYHSSADEEKNKNKTLKKDCTRNGTTPLPPKAPKKHVDFLKDNNSEHSKNSEKKEQDRLVFATDSSDNSDGEKEKEKENKIVAYPKSFEKKLGILRKTSNHNIIRGVIRRPTMFKNFGLVFNHLLNRENEAYDQCCCYPADDNIPKQGQEAAFQHYFTRINKKAVTGIFPKNGELAQLRELSSNFEQCRKMKKDIEMYRNSVEMLTFELNAIQSKSAINEAILTDFQEKQKVISSSEFENVRRIVKIYKTFYTEELLSKRHMIEELVKLVDEMYLNTSLGKARCKSSTLFQMYLQAPNRKRSKELFSDYYEYKKEVLITENSNFEDYNNTSVKLAEAMVQDGGTATKKLDYILFQIEKNYEDINIEFGSGLHGNLPAKSPLARNLTFSLMGDTCSEVNSCNSEDS